MSYGSLKSYLNAMEPETRESLVQQLLDFREEGGLWTDTSEKLQPGGAGAVISPVSGRRHCSS